MDDGTGRWMHDAVRATIRSNADQPGGETAQRQAEDAVVPAIDDPGGPRRDDEVAPTAEIGARRQCEIDGVLVATRAGRGTGVRPASCRSETHAAPLITTGAGIGPAGRMTPATTFVAGIDPGHRLLAAAALRPDSGLREGEAPTWSHLDRDLDRRLDRVRDRVDPDDRRGVRDADPDAAEPASPASSDRNCRSARP